jgi:RNA polymerase sigma factor (sigma-70 family)
VRYTRRVVDFFRSRSIHRHETIDFDIPIFDECQRAVENDCLAKAMAPLREQDQTIICWKLVEGWSLKEISTQLDITEAGARTRLKRAKRALKENLTDILQESA